MSTPSAPPPSAPLWTNDQLAAAVKACTNWVSVMRELGFGERSSSAGAIRLGLDTSHLNRLSYLGRQPSEAPAEISDCKPDLKYLRVAAPAAAAMWFALRGCAVSFPAEPTVYDLLVDGLGGISRVQVKTTTFSSKYGWAVGVGHHPDTHAKKRGQRVSYDPAVIDLFFIIDGDLTMYLIPSRAIAGRLQVILRTYKKYIVGNAIGVLGPTADAAQPTPEGRATA
jgi:hypothetical protein